MLTVGRLKRFLEERDAEDHWPIGFVINPSMKGDDLQYVKIADSVGINYKGNVIMIALYLPKEK